MNISSRNSIFVFLTVILLTACSEDYTGYIQVANDENAGGANIVSVYVSEDCTSGWGLPVAVNLSVAPNTWTNYFAVEWEEDLPIHPTQDEDDDITVDVFACFSSGTCGDQKGLLVRDDKVTAVVIRDEGKLSFVGYCG